MMKKDSRRILAALIFCLLAAVSTAQAEIIYNGNNTVTDTETGLIWHTESFGPYTWQQALEACETENWEGFADWRLPNRNELQSLVDYSTHTPSIDSYLSSATYSNYYWTSTTNRANPAVAWLVSFQYGNVTYDTKTKGFYIRPVRGGEAVPNSKFDCPTDFVDNGDGTVTDINTGLTWLQSSLGPFTWQQALAEAERLVQGEKTDWRLPNRNELQSIVFYSRHTPAIDNTVFDNTQSSGYWTSTTNRANPAAAWLVNFQYGNVTYDTKTKGFYIRPVHGGDVTPSGQCNSSLADNGNGTVTDTATGLMWHQDGFSARTWEEALATCENLYYAGHNDWRLPDRNELQSLVFYARHTPAIDPVGFPITQSAGYWTSTTNTANPAAAWLVNFQYGNVTYDTKTDNYYVRPVRGQQNDDMVGTISFSLPEGAATLQTGQQFSITFNSMARMDHYEWDLNNDGVTDVTSRDNFISFWYNEPGTYMVRAVAVALDGSRIVAWGLIEVEGVGELSEDFSFVPWYPKTDNIASEVMRGGRAIRHYRLVDGSGQPILYKKLFYRFSGYSQINEALSDDMGFVKIVTPALSASGQTFYLNVTDSTGNASSMSVTDPPHFSVDVGERTFSEEYELLLSVGGSIGKGLGVKLGPLELKALKATVGASNSVASRFVYENREEDADFFIQSTLGESLETELAAGLYGRVFKTKTLPKVEAGIEVEAQVANEIMTEYDFPSLVINNEINDNSQALRAGIALLESGINSGKQVAVGMDRLLLGLIDKYVEQYTGITADVTGNTVTLSGEASIGASLTLKNPIGASAGSEWGVSGEAFEGSYAYSLGILQQEDSSAMSVTQSVVAGMDFGKFSLIYGQKFAGDKRRNNTPKFEIPWFTNSLVSIEGEQGVTATHRSDGSTELEYRHLLDRDDSGFFIVGSTVVEKNMYLRTDKEAVISEIAGVSEMAGQMCFLDPEENFDFYFSPTHYNDLRDGFLDVSAGSVNWEEVITERDMISIPLDFEVSLGVSLGLDLSATALKEVNFVGSRGMIDDGAQFATEFYEKDSYIFNNIKQYQPFMNAARDAVREIASQVIETIEGWVVEGTELVVEIGVNVTAGVKSVADTFVAGSRIVISKLEPLQESYTVKSLTSKGIEGTASTIGDVYIVNVLDEAGVALETFATPLELTIGYTEEMLIAAGYILADASALRIYRWDGVSGYYIFVGGTVDEIAKTVTAAISQPGQYLLAIDGQAPMVQDFYVSDGTPTASFTIRVSDAFSGLDPESIIFSIDDIEMVNAENQADYFNAISGELYFQPFSALAGGDHLAELTVCDNLANCDTFSWMFAVNDSPPLVIHEQISESVSFEPLQVTAEASDDEGQPAVFLYFRALKDNMDFLVVEMIYNDISGQFEAEIPTSYLTSFGVRYFLSAIDTSGNVTETELFDIAIDDTTGPDIPGGVKVFPLTGFFEFEWDASPDIDTMGYRFYLGDNPDNMFFYEEIGLSGWTQLADSFNRSFFAVTGFDAAGNEGIAVGPRPVQLEYDTDMDLDVDGADLAAAVATGGIDIERFAVEFGGAW
ncbi:MAG: DUF1566 domain-containing protein [Desulfobulbaceae bacterium]|nr:DUF1566 domain-containing protein [Desulfobulbaceae bacterium]